MLPWLREKIALRKQRWLRSRNEEIKPQNETEDDTKSNNESTSNELMYLRIVAPRFGKVFSIHVSYFDSGLQIREKALKKLELSHQSPSRSSFHHNTDINSVRLVRSSTNQPFKDYESILTSNVRNMEEFILSIKRTDVNFNRLITIQTCHGPTEKDILNRTKHLPLTRPSISTSINPSLDSAFLQGDLQHDLRKILSEIAKYSAYILGSLPYAEKLIKYYRQKILLSLHNHQDIVKLLMDMGFSQKDVKRALKIQGNNYASALDWLVENVSKEDYDEDEGQSNQIEAPSALNSNESVNDTSDDLNENIYKKFYSSTFPSTSSIFYPKHKATSIKDRVEGLLEIVRHYSEKNDEPSTKADTVNSLINMGFEIQEIQQAFDLTNNQTTAACEWLLEHSSNQQNFNALRESIFVESHILKILLSTPQIQFSLSSPKFFIAYCSLLENYSSLNIFFNDIESQSLLQFILRTYHEEKIYFHTFDKLSTIPTTSS